MKKLMFIVSQFGKSSCSLKRALFERYGRVVEADVMTDKNFGFVHVDAGMGKNTSLKIWLFLARSKTIWKGPNGFNPTEGQGIRDAGKIESIKY